MNPDDLNTITSGFENLHIEPLPDDAPEWARVLNDNISVVAESVDRAATAVESIAREAGPLVDTISNSPIVKMMGGGKR